MKKRVIKKSIVYAVCAVFFLIVYVYFTGFVAINSRSASVLTVLFTLVFTYAGSVLSEYIERDKLRRFIKGSAAACVIAFAAEVFVFNLKSYTKDNATYYVEFSDIRAEKSDAVKIDDDSIMIKENISFEVILENEDIKAAQLGFSELSEENSEKELDKNEIRCLAYIKDDNFSRKYIKIGQKLFNTDYGKCDFSFKPYGTLHSIKFSFENVKKPFKLTSICFNKALPFRFYELRYFTLFLILMAVWAIKVFGLHKIIYNRNNNKHKCIVIAVTAVCSASMLFFLSPADKTLKYSDEMKMNNRDPYVQTFDAFHKGQVNLDIETPEELSKIDNPYDFSIRDEEKIYYEWDRAFYNGKYYSYFGVAPVLIFYYPFYLISGGRLPSLNVTAVVFGMISIAVMSGAIMAFIKRFIKKPNFLLVLLGIVTSGFASGMYFNVNGTSIYTIQEIFGICFLMSCVWCGVEACGCINKKLQPVLFGLSGLFFSTCVASKPTIALCALILAPLYLEYLFVKDKSIKEKLISVTCFIVPVAVGLAGVMWYNNARFDSPFQFGAVYQLTVSNVNANSLKLSYLPNAIIHYFTQPVRFDGIFPFTRIWPMFIENTESYIYSDSSIGIMTFPYIFTAICGLPFLLWHIKRKKGEKLLSGENQIRKFTYILMLLLAVLISWMNYCIAGVILRYVCDILPVITLMSVLVILDIQQQTISHPAVSVKTTCVISIVSAATIALVFLELLSIQGFMLHQRFPNIDYVMEDMICFWN